MEAAIVTLTINPALDISTRVDHVVPERKLRCGAPAVEPGGGGINVSRAIGKLGGQSVALYTRGGATGQHLSACLEQEGLDHRPVPIRGVTRESFTAYESATGLQYRFIMPGPTLSAGEWQQCLDALAGIVPRPGYIIASGSLPPGVPEEFYARVARIGKDLGARVIVDTSGPALPVAVREGVFLIKPNLRELSQLTGHERAEEGQHEERVTQMIASGQCEAVVVSLGAAGALLGSKEGCERLRAPTVPIESKVGAGDSMVAGIVLGLARGLSLRDAARFGVAAGAAAVMTPGSELCRREDTERLYRQMNG
jgi:6-phosphofructokinase 2